MGLTVDDFPFYTFFREANIKLFYNILIKTCNDRFSFLRFFLYTLDGFRTEKFVINRNFKPISSSIYWFASDYTSNATIGLWKETFEYINGDKEIHHGYCNTRGYYTDPRMP